MEDPLPEVLAITWARAREQVTRSPDRHLTPHTRESIYRAIGPFHNPPPKVESKDVGPLVHFLLEA
jgi:hypothetical protein